MTNQRITNSDSPVWCDPENSRYPGLDGLRALAILIVIWHNVGVKGGREYEEILLKLNELLINSGWIGVQLFFVISGFLITGILLNTKYQRENRFRNFYMRRVLRIFPLYFGTLFLLFIFLPFFDLLPDQYAPDQAHQVWFWLYGVNWISPFYDGGHLGHIWSLAIEEQFYLAWPFAVIFLSQNNLIRLCFFLIISAIAARWALVEYLPEIGGRAAYNFTIARWDALAVGALLAIWFRCKDWHRSLRYWAPRVAVITIFLIGVQVIQNRNFTAVGAGTLIFNQTLSAFWFGICLFFAIDNAGSKLATWYQAILNLSFFRIVAKYSYAMYVFHVPISNYWFEHYASPTDEMSTWQTLLTINFNCIVIALVSFLAALISWQIMEEPFLKMKARF